MQRRPPLQRCVCGRSYRSWKRDAGCGRDDCRAMPTRRGWLREMQVRMGNRTETPPENDDGAPKIGDRVLMRYGAATVVDFPGHDLVGVVADIGQYWLVDLLSDELQPLAEDAQAREGTVS